MRRARRSTGNNAVVVEPTIVAIIMLCIVFIPVIVIIALNSSPPPPTTTTVTTTTVQPTTTTTVTTTTVPPTTTATTVPPTVPPSTCNASYYQTLYDYNGAPLTDSEQVSNIQYDTLNNRLITVKTSTTGPAILSVGNDWNVQLCGIPGIGAQVDVVVTVNQTNGDLFVCHTCNIFNFNLTLSRFSSTGAIIWSTLLNSGSSGNRCYDRPSLDHRGFVYTLFSSTGADEILVKKWSASTGSLLWTASAGNETTGYAAFAYDSVADRIHVARTLEPGFSTTLMLLDYDPANGNLVAAANFSHGRLALNVVEPDGNGSFYVTADAGVNFQSRLFISKHNSLTLNRTWNTFIGDVDTYYFPSGYGSALFDTTRNLLFASADVTVVTSNLTLFAISPSDGTVTYNLTRPVSYSVTHSLALYSANKTMYVSYNDYLFPGISTQVVSFCLPE